jgi:outer membrane lipoprotein-sorting protein
MALISSAAFGAEIPLSSSNGGKFVESVEKYINSLKHISGRFEQRSSNGAKDEGVFYISKPGRMRLEYKSPILLVADGTSLVYQDKSLDQISYVPLDANPAAVVLSGSLSLSDPKSQIAPKEIRDLGETTELDLSSPHEKQSGSITLLFANRPLSLAGWRVKDAHNITTEVRLSEIKPAADGFPASLFKITRASRGINDKRPQSKYY